jgi:hypothetical protein
MPKRFGQLLGDNMNAKLSIVLVACVALFVSACGSSPQSLILGKWEVDSAIKMTAEFSRDGTAKLTMFGQTLQGTYKLDTGNELEWTLNGKTTKTKVSVTATELELTDDANQTIKYKRK